MKKIISLILACLLVSFNFVVYAEDVPEAVLDARKSILRVRCLWDGGAAKGTGFVIARDGDTTYIATNLHCVTYEENGEVFWVEKLYIVDKNLDNEPIPVDIDNITQVKDKAGDRLDIAILEVTDKRLKNFPIMPLRKNENVKVGEAVYTLGFPGAADDVAADDNLPSTFDKVTLASGIVSLTEVYMAEGTLDENEIAIQHTALINGGNSGGPLVDKYGYAIGINTWSGLISTGEKSGLYYAGISDYIIDAADSLGIKVDVRTGEEKTETETETTTTAETTTVQTTTAETTTPETTTVAETTTAEAVPAMSNSTSSDSAIGIIFGLLFAGGIVAVVIVIAAKASSKNKNTPPQPQVNEQNTPPNNTIPQQSDASMKTVPIIKETTVYIFGVSGNYAGKKIPVNGSMLLGRSTECSLVFPAGTQGVSAVHCEIKNQNGKIVLTDRKATYGTFVNKKKMTANSSVTLKPGDKFNLGSKETEFQVL
jgi:hypothetical protein